MEMEIEVPANFYSELEKLAKRLRKHGIHTIPEELILWLVAARMERGFTDLVLEKTARTGKEIIESYWRKDGEDFRRWARETFHARVEVDHARDEEDRGHSHGYGHNDETGFAR